MWQFVTSFPCQKAANGAISMTSRNKGIVLMVIGSLFAALMAALIKLSAGMPTLQKLFFRSLVGVVFAGFGAGRVEGNLWGKNKKLLFLRGVLGFLGLAGYFLAIERLPLGNAVILNQVSPFFTIFLGLIFLKEQVNGRQWFALGIAAAGVVLINKPGPGGTFFAATAGLFSAFASGASHVIIRELRKTDGPYTIVFYYTAITCLCTLPFMLSGHFTLPSWQQLGSILAAGVAATLSQIFLSAAYRYAEAGDLSIYLYTNTIFSSLIGFLLWREKPVLLSSLGVLLVLCGAFLNWQSQKNNVQKLQNRA